MTILADSREPRAYAEDADAVRYLPNGHGDYWLCRSLPPEADMRKPDELREQGVLVRTYERKTLQDLWNSLRSGRLNVQLERTDVLLVEITDRVWGRLRDDQLLNVINATCEHHVVKLVIGPTHLARTLRSDEAKLQRGEAFGTLRVPVVRNSGESRDRRIRALTSLGLGIERAKLVLDKYDKDLVIALRSVDEWSTIRGIGPSTVRKVKDILGGR